MYTHLDDHSLSYFTDVEKLRSMFKKMVAAPTLTKRVLIIHGIGGVGKSSLLRMFRRHCEWPKVPVALASGDEAKFAFDVLCRWAEDLEVDIALPTFKETFDYYRRLLERAAAQAETVQDAPKTAEAVGGTFAGTAIGSALAGVMIRMGAEAFRVWLRNTLKIPDSDVDLILDPSQRLTNDFLGDISKAANERRIVLMLDTFEQVTALNAWVGGVAKKLHANVLLVIAGREMINWEHQWNGWLASCRAEELEPMSKDVMYDLIRRYYESQVHAYPNRTQTETIIGAARGLPLMVTLAGKILIEHPENLEEIRVNGIEDLIKILLKSAQPDFLSVLRAAAILRYFNPIILNKITNVVNVIEAYEKLRVWPIVSSAGKDGWKLHESIRAILDENLESDDPDLRAELDERAANYFEGRLANAGSEERMKLQLELLYHKIRSSEDEGMKLFQERAEELVRYQLVDQLRALMNDANTYALKKDNSKLWREYYNARLVDLFEGRSLDALKVYQSISENERAAPMLRAYASCDWATILFNRRIGDRQEALRSASQLYERSLELSPLDAKLVKSLTELGRIHRDRGEWDEAWSYLNKVRDFCEKSGMRYNTALNCLQFQYFYAYRGDWKGMIDMQERGLLIAEELGDIHFLKSEFLVGLKIAWLWAGRCAEAEGYVQEGLKIRQELGLISSLGDLGLILGSQDKYQESLRLLSKSVENARKQVSFSKRESAVILGFYGIVLVRNGELGRAIEILEESARIKREIQDPSYLLESLNWLGRIHEITGNREAAISNYSETLSYRWNGRLYLECTALTGLVRVKQAQEDYATIPSLLAEAEQLAQQYEYNDHLASLRLTQAMTRDKVEWNEQTTTLDYFKQAMVYALRYNRFLLDEVLSGRPQGTPLSPIIPWCLERGEEGRSMLIALHDWWKTEVNDIGMSRPSMISLVPEGMPLVEAEQKARGYERGDGSQQKSVIEQIEAVL